MGKRTKDRAEVDEEVRGEASTEKGGEEEMSVYGWQKRQEAAAAEEKAAEDKAVAEALPPGSCPQCGQPMTQISPRKRKCKPCGAVERSEQ